MIAGRSNEKGGSNPDLCGPVGRGKNVKTIVRKVVGKGEGAVLARVRTGFLGKEWLFRGMGLKCGAWVAVIAN